ncbi:MAG TPA: creatininase family protein [Edaphobacter sp.]|jgi:creatinine amidohydrolase|nr:creatininase family protein [Edaphobacter sp.]
MNFHLKRFAGFTTHLAVPAFLLATLNTFSVTTQAEELKSATRYVSDHSSHSVFLEDLTWPELYRAIHEQGKTTVLIFNGGTEQRGPQGAIGGHTFIARATAEGIAQKLGNAIVAPVNPFSLNRANPEQPGTIGISSALFTQINQEVTEQLIQNGFKIVVLLGDHGGGQHELKDLAQKLDAKYSPTGVRVFYSDGPYDKANESYFDWLDKNGYPPSQHAGLPDTSELLYLEGKNQNWVRKDLLPVSLGDSPRKHGDASAPSDKRVNNGIVGDARRSSVALGKRFIDLKIEYGAEEIRSFQQQTVATPAAIQQ